MPDLAKLILLDGNEEDESEISYQKVLELGKEFLKTSADAFRQARKLVQPNDPANICYTSVSYTHLDVYKRQILFWMKEEMCQ